MFFEGYEASPRWQATVEYDGHNGRQTILLMDDRLDKGRYYWFIVHYRGRWPWQAIRAFDARGTARLVAEGKIRLIKGTWPAVVADILAPLQMENDWRLNIGMENGP